MQPVYRGSLSFCQPEDGHTFRRTELSLQIASLRKQTTSRGKVVWFPAIQNRNEISRVFGDWVEVGLAWPILREKYIFVDLKPILHSSAQLNVWLSVCGTEHRCAAFLGSGRKALYGLCVTCYWGTPQPISGYSVAELWISSLRILQQN